MLQNLLNRLGYVVHSTEFLKSKYIEKRDFRPLDQLFYRFLHPNFFFLQIGGNDGVSHDPIHHLVTRENVRGIILEPIPDLFEQLCKTYAGYPNVTCINRAIHATEPVMTIYRVNPTCNKYPAFTKGTPSFRKEHHSLSGIAEEDVVAVEVQCSTVAEVLQQHNVNSVDLLQIDTEGYDWEIVKSVDLDALAPSIISFEHGVHEGIMTNDAFLGSVALLVEKGFNLHIGNHDIVAYDRKRFRSQ